MREVIEGGEVVARFPIGARTHCLARLVEFDRGTFVDVRLFVANKTGGLTRTGKGVCVHPSYLGELAEAVAALAAATADVGEAELDGGA